MSIEAANAATNPPAPDPFDLDALRLNQDFAAAGVQRRLLTVPVRKPGKAEFVRAHPDPGHRLDTLLLEVKDQRSETYLVAPALRAQLAGEATVGVRRLATAVTRQGVAFLWPLRLPGPDGRLDAWGQSALDAADLARTGWVRVTANMGLGAYDVYAAGQVEGPAWPAEPFQEPVRLAFRDKVIDRWDHPVLKALRGEL